MRYFIIYGYRFSSCPLDRNNFKERNTQLTFTITMVNCRSSPLDIFRAHQQCILSHLHFKASLNAIIQDNLRFQSFAITYNVIIQANNRKCFLYSTLNVNYCRFAFIRGLNSQYEERLQLSTFTSRRTLYHFFSLMLMYERVEKT